MRVDNLRGGLAVASPFPFDTTYSDKWGVALVCPSVLDGPF